MKWIDPRAELENATPDRSVWLLVAGIAYPILNVFALRQAASLMIGLSPGLLLTFAFIAPGVAVVAAMLTQYIDGAFRWPSLAMFALWIAFLGYCNYQLYWMAVASV